MPHTVSIDSAVEAQAAAFANGGKGVQVGLLVGRLAGGRDLVLDLVRTPERDGLPPAELLGIPAPQQRGKSKGGAATSGPALRIDQEWVVEHAAQVSRLLPGGLSIRGVFAVGPEAALTACAGILARTVQDVAKEVEDAAPASLVLHVDAARGEVTARELGLGSATGPLQPCDVRTSDLRSQLVLLSARHQVDQRLLLTGEKQTLLKALRRAVEQEVQDRVHQAICLIGGQLHPGDRQVVEVAAGASSLKVELASPAATAAAPLGALALERGCATAEARASISLRGMLDCRAVVHKRDSLASALEALQSDMERSLCERAELAAEAATDQQQQQEAGVVGGSEARHVVLCLPRRVLLEPTGADVATSLCYTDFLGQGEAVDAARERMEELLGANVLRGGELVCREGDLKPAACGKQRAAGQGSANICGLLIAAAGAAMALAWAWYAGVAS
eukprot:scaffold17.g484.t1